MISRGTWVSAALLSGALVLAGCSSTPNPVSEMATARTAVDSARRAGAGELVPSEMSQAQELLTAAERAQASENYDSARRNAETAKAVAELAEERARVERANKAKSEIDGTLQELRKQASQIAPR